MASEATGGRDRTERHMADLGTATVASGVPGVLAVRPFSAYASDRAQAYAEVLKTIGGAADAEAYAIDLDLLANLKPVAPACRPQRPLRALPARAAGSRARAEGPRCVQVGEGGGRPHVLLSAYDEMRKRQARS